MTSLFLVKLIYWGSFLIFLFILVLISLWKKSNKKWQKAIIAFFFILSGFFIWARFIETQIIISKETKINIGFEGKIVLIADTHLGTYKNSAFLDQVVSKINKIDPDMVLIAGDFVYFPENETKQALKELFAPLKKINAPVFAVLGNHDGVDNNFGTANEELKEALPELKVVLIENEYINFENFTLLGLGSNWRNEDKIELLDQFTEEDNLVVLAHNPDTTLKYINKKADLTLTGHTHGGQIRIPLLYKKAIPTNGDFDKGLTQEENTTLFITSGLGETGLPMRLFNPPIIDVLILY